MRAIDAENIRIKPEFMHNVCGMAMIRVEDVVRILNEQPTIQPEPHWIPVADGLPNIREDVLVSYYDEVMVGWLNDDGTWFAEGFGRLNMNDIAAWRLLPEPYKEVTT